MSIRFDNFKSMFSADILKRGRDYYRNQHILDLSYDDENTWDAQVSGSELYDVTVVRQPDGSLDCECTCPYAEDGDLCKHIAAVLYAIEADFPEATGKKKASGSSTGKRKPSKKETLKQALEAMSHGELVKMLLDWAEAERQITDQLLLRVGAKGETADDYMTMVKATFRVGKGDYGYIDYRGAQRIVRQLELLIGQANQKHREGQIRVAIAIFEAIINTVMAEIETMEMTDGLYEIMGDCLEGLARCGADLASAERRAMLTTMLKYAQTYLGTMEIEIGPYELAADLAQNHEDIDLVLTTIQKSMRKNPYSFSETYAAQIELRMIKRLGSSEEVERFINQHRHLDVFRIELIEQAIAKNDFETAQTLIQEGRQKTPVMSRFETMGMNYVSTYDVLALDIAKKQNNIPQIITLARQMWITGHRSDDYYLLKRTVESEKWPAFVAGLLKETKGAPEVVAWIYNEEQRWQDLFDIVKQHPTYTMSLYQKTLEEKFPEEITKYYEKVVFDSLRDASNREVYKQACSLITRIQELGDEERAMEMVQLLRAEYPRRKALMEELDKI